PLEQAYRATATFIGSVLDLAGANSLYTGDEANNNTIKSVFDDTDGPNIIYFAGGGKNDILYFNSTVQSVLFNEYNKCPYTSVDETVSCIGFGIIPSFKNRLVMFSTSDYFTRLSSNDTNASLWDMNNGNASDWNYQDSLILQMLHNSETDGPVAFIGSTSVNWLTSESLAKSFFLNLIDGMDIGSALVSAKNIVILNRESVGNQTTKDFLSHLESSTVLYGVPQTDSEQNTGYVDYAIQNIQIESNPSTYDTISWNSTIIISPKASVAPLYLAETWQSTYGTVWYKNVTEPSAGKINITFLAALSGEYIPDLEAYDLSVNSLPVAQKNFTQMTVEIERTKIVPSSPNTHQYNQSEKLVASSLILGSDFIYGLKNNRTIIFAMPYSPNETLSSSSSKTVNISFTTEGVSIETLSVSGKGSGQGQGENNIIVIFNIVNPTNLTISNLELNYPIPLLTSTCSFSGPYLYGSCVNGSGFASQNISQVMPGRTQYTLDYVTESNMINSTHVKYDYSPLLEFSGFVFNWGDNVSLNSSIASSSSVDAEIFTEILLLNNTGNIYRTPVSVNSIVWSNITSATTGPSPTYFSPVWQVQENTSETQPGEYLIKTYVLENGTSNYLLKNIFYVNITDELVLTIDQTNVSSNDDTGYIPQGNFNFSFTGTASKKTGKYLNKTVIGPSIYVYLDGSTQQGSVRSLSDDEGNIENIIIENINPGIGG
ncbi:MAG: hypothetical protein KAR51_02275, partial [Candidatus Aenigmarchaeota archaeon]|nr:hypothetical protein [Candidatus Aenigmarchaeota archaeon]